MTQIICYCSYCLSSSLLLSSFFVCVFIFFDLWARDTEGDVYFFLFSCAYLNTPLIFQWWKDSFFYFSVMQQRFLVFTFTHIYYVVMYIIQFYSTDFFLNTARESCLMFRVSGFQHKCCFHGSSHPNNWNALLCHDFY